MNLQNPGEHSHCGPNKKLEESGFSYNFSDFTSKNIPVVCYGWDKVTEGSHSINFIMKIVREMAKCIYQDKKQVS